MLSSTEILKFSKELPLMALKQDIYTVLPSFTKTPSPIAKYISSFSYNVNIPGFNIHV